MLIAKGYEVACRIDGGILRAPQSYGMMHDSSGKDFPKDMVLVAPFQRERRTVSDDEASRYFGYTPRAGVVRLPSRNLRSWNRIGEVSAIDYRRPGTEGGDYRHEFAAGDAGGLYWLFPGTKPMLFHQRRMLLLHFTDGVILNWRGFVWP